MEMLRSNNVSSIALTSDTWSNIRLRRRTISSVVGHFFNYIRCLEKNLIGLRLFDESHTDANNYMMILM
jgi:hypothetical protein